MAGGWCLLLPGDVPLVPEVFPSSFFDEHFYFAATATMTPANGARALLVLAEEAAFAVGPAVPGDQITFSRIRVKLTDVPVTGTYRFIHPYGEELIHAEAGQARGIFFTDDVGINCAPGNFECSLNSRLGPFLLPSAAPGGAEMPALTAANPTPDTDPAHFGGVFAPTAYPGTGKAYIADPGRIGPVTGSPLPNFIDSSGQSRNHNIFRIEGPPGSALGIDPATGAAVDWIETTDFNLMGRLYSGAMPGRIDVSSASYTRNASGQKLDVVATAAATTQARLPTQPKPPAVAPQLTFFDAPCSGTVDALGTVHPPYGAPLGATETQMFSAASMHWGQSRPAAIPSAVCVKDGSARDALGNLVPVFAPKIVTDEVTVSKAIYDPALATLTVAAASSDEIRPPVLTLAYGTFLGSLVGGQIVVPGMIAPPADVFVRSGALGSSRLAVSTAFPVPPPAATDDSFTFPANSGPQVLAVLANDVNAVGGAVTLASAPSLGTAVANADGTVTYTPNPNASGADTFAYTVTVGNRVSNRALVSLNILLVPKTNNDSFSFPANSGPQVLAVLANDLDTGGGTVTLTSLPALGTAAVNADGTVAYTPNANAAGADAFTYTVTVGTQVSNVGSVAINIIPNPKATNDSFTFPGNSPPQVLPVLANDLNAAGGTVTLASAPSLGSAAVNADGTVTYTPNPNATGTDSFTYAVTIGTQVSNAATVTLTITPPNLPPVAANDTASAIVNTPLAINVLANDSDPNGAADLAAAVNVTQPTPAGATVSVAGGIVTFTATAAGTYTFTYQAQDAGGLVSASAATVTVKAVAPDTIALTRSDYVVAKSNLLLEGTISPALRQFVRVDFLNSAGSVLGTAGLAATAADGKWVMNKIIPLPSGTRAVRVTSQSANGGVRISNLIFK